MCDDRVKKAILRSTQRLKELMQEKGLTQADISRDTGINKQTLSMYTSGKRDMRADKAYIIATTYGKDPIWLMGLDVEIADGPTLAERAAMAPRINAYAKKIAALTPEKRKQVYSFIDFLSEEEGEKDDD